MEQAAIYEQRKAGESFTRLMNLMGCAEEMMEKTSRIKVNFNGVESEAWLDWDGENLTVRIRNLNVIMITGEGFAPIPFAMATGIQANEYGEITALPR